MKRCRWCRKEIADDAATVCPHAGCGRTLDPDRAMRGIIPPPPPPPGTARGASRPAAPEVLVPPPAAPPPSPPVTVSCGPASSGVAATGPTAARPPVGPPDSELARRLEGLKEQVSRKRRRSLLLGLGAAAALLVGFAALGAYYLSSVFAYAQLDPTIDVRRDAFDADRLLLGYRPMTRGTVAFRRADADRDTELLDQVTPAAVGQGQTLQWRGVGLQPGDPIWVTSRRGLRLVRSELRVPARPPVLLASIYARRTLANREQWIARYGGSASSEKAVNDGLRWLARHQADNGSWSPRCLGSGAESKCNRASPCSGPGGQYEMALTGLSLLAFQAGGHYAFNGNNYSDAVRKGLDWLVAQQRPDGGLIRPAHPRGTGFYTQYMYEHGMATFALAEACAVAKAADGPAQDAYRQAMNKALQFIYRMQHDDGGWRYNDQLREASDTSVTGWQVLALKSAKEAGVKLDAACIAKVRTFFTHQATGENGRTGYVGRSVSTEATTGVGMLARQFLLDEPDGPLVRQAAAYLAGYAERTWPARFRRRDTDYYLWYNCALAMFQAGGENWQRWNGVVRDTLVELQQHGGCTEGSWAPDGRWGSEGGRIYATALAALTLEVYYRYMGQDDTAEPATAASAVAAPATPANPAWAGQGSSAGNAARLQPNVPSSGR